MAAQLVSGNIIVSGTANIYGTLTLGNGATGTGSLGTLTAGTGILGTAQTWTAVQTFDSNNLRLAGATSGFLTQNANATTTTYTVTWPAAVASSSGQALTSDTAGNLSWSTLTTGVSSVSNSDGSLTISPTTGAVVASLNVAHANTWSVLQTFDVGIQLTAIADSSTSGKLFLSSTTADTLKYYDTVPTLHTIATLDLAQTFTALQTFGTNISFMGEQVSGTTVTTGTFLYDNGTNWIRQALAAGTGISVSDYTITNTGVTSIVAGTAITISGATGAVTINNAGVTSLAAGTGISVSASTGGITVTNTGVTSITAGTGISVSSSTGSITITNTGLTAADDASETELTTTGSTTITTFTPTTQGNFMLCAYFRVVTAATTVTLTATWTDSTGAQTYTWINASSMPVNSYSMTPIYINAATSAITVTATAGTASQVYVSSSILSF